MAGGYTPAFASLYTGSLYGKWPTAAVWASLLPLIDARGQIEMTYEAISGMTGWPLDLLRVGIAELMKPDPGSRSPAEDGRRLVPLDPGRSWGWRVVNVQKYRDRASGADQVSDGRNAEKVRRYKERHRETPADTTGHRRDTKDTYSYSDSNTDSNSKNTDRAAAQPEPGEFVEIRREYPKRAGSQRWHDALGAFRARVREGTSPQAILSGVRRYAAFIRATGKERTEHVQQAATFLGKNRSYELPWHPPAKPETAGERLMRTLNVDDNSRVIEHDPAIPALAGH
jgi:hypothetical protein